MREPTTVAQAFRPAINWTVMKKDATPLQHVQYLWKDAEADRLKGVDRLVYRSNKLGEDLTLTNTGGGNTSSKLIGNRSADRRGRRGAVGERLRRRSADREARQLLVAVSGQGAGDAAAVPGRSRIADPRRRSRTRCPDVQPLHLQPEPARLLDRHAAAHVRAVPARRSHAPERRHRRRRVGEPGAALQGDLRRRRDLRAVAAPRLRPRVDDRGADHGQPEGERRHPRPPRPDHLGQRRQDLLRNRARDHRARDGIHRAARQGREDLRRPEVRSRSPSQRRREILAELLPWLRGQISTGRRFVGTVQDDERILRFVNSVDAPRLADLGTSCPDHFLRTKIKPLFVDWNPETRRCGGAALVAAGRGRPVSQGLRRLLRALQATRLAGHARPEPDGRPRSPAWA